MHWHVCPQAYCLVKYRRLGVLLCCTIHIIQACINSMVFLKIYEKAPPDILPTAPLSLRLSKIHSLQIQYCQLCQRIKKTSFSHVRPHTDTHGACITFYNVPCVNRLFTCCTSSSVALLAGT